MNKINPSQLVSNVNLKKSFSDDVHNHKNHDFLGFVVVVYLHT
ncbi:MAG: hypothetical protein YK1309IOTA_680014 [Marine Group I thaumarchaeote]|nr:MAG: hypothetical protein YK1309IOTA_680014 [Marine Group I thaumarchaeote]